MPASQQRVLNKKLSQIFRINGLTVRPDAMQPLYDVLEGEPEWESVLNQVLEQVQQQKSARKKEPPDKTPDVPERTNISDLV